MSKIHFRWRCLLATGWLLLAAGCELAAPPLPSGESPPAPHSAEVELNHTVYFATDSASLATAEEAALRRFVASLDERLIVEQIVVGHADVRAGDAYNDALSARRAAAVLEVMEEAGLESPAPSRHALGERFPVAADDEATGWRLSRRVEVLVRGLILAEPACPDWSRPSAAMADNLPTSNFGCATTVNLMRMVADPRDLVEGAPLGPADGTREAAAVHRYRTDAVKQLQVESAAQ